MNINRVFPKLSVLIGILLSAQGCAGDPRAVALPLTYPDGSPVTTARGEAVLAGFQTHGSATHSNATAIYERGRPPSCATCAKVGAVVTEPSTLRQATNVLGTATAGAGAVMTGIGMMEYGYAASDGKLGTNYYNYTEENGEKNVLNQKYSQKNYGTPGYGYDSGGPGSYYREGLGNDRRSYRENGLSFVPPKGREGWNDSRIGVTGKPLSRTGIRRADGGERWVSSPYGYGGNGTGYRGYGNGYGNGYGYGTGYGNPYGYGTGYGTGYGNATPAGWRNGYGYGTGNGAYNTYASNPYSVNPSYYANPPGTNAQVGSPQWISNQRRARNAYTNEYYNNQQPTGWFGKGPGGEVVEEGSPQWIANQRRANNAAYNQYYNIPKTTSWFDDLPNARDTYNQTANPYYTGQNTNYY